MKRAGNTLAATLVTAAIILILVVVFFKGSGAFGVKQAGTPRADGKGKTVPGLALAKSRDTACMENLSSVRSSIMIHKDEVENTWPASLSELQLPDSMLKCVFGDPYVYDPKTGAVYCPHPGHEKY